MDYSEELYDITQAAYKKYPLKYRPKINKKWFVNDLKGWDKYICYGAFEKETGKLVAYARLSEKSGMVDFMNLKSNPEMEKKEVNAAVVYKIVTDLEDFILNGGYICDGARNVNHATNFQDYLEKYFGFRKAYCHLHVIYRYNVLKCIVKILKPLSGLLEKFDENKIVHNINVLLKMERYAHSG